jgi:hypothetical protein
MEMSKTYTITKTHGRTGSESNYSGTVAELVAKFSYTLESGHGYNPKINVNPKTAKSLVTALNKSVEETQGACYSQDSYELATV